MYSLMQHVLNFHQIQLHIEHDFDTIGTFNQNSLNFAFQVVQKTITK